MQLTPRLDRYLQDAGTILGLAALACLVVSNWLAAQIITPFTSQTSTSIVSQIPSSIMTSTSTVSNISCTTHPCTITENVGETMILSEYITGYASHVIPTVQKEAVDSFKAFLENLAIVLLLASVALQIFRWVKSKVPKVKQTRHGTVVLSR
jgi:hypothetical protein